MNWYTSKLLVFKMIAHHRDHMMSYSSTLSLRNNAVKKSNVCLHLGKLFLKSLFWHRKLLWFTVEISLRLVVLRSRLVTQILLFWWRHNQFVIVDVEDVWHLGVVAEERADWPNVFVHCDVIIAEFQIELGFRLNFNFIFIIIIRLIYNNILHKLF